MEVKEFINRDKIKVDDIISISLLLSIVMLFIFFKLIVFTSLMVYPICSAFLYGIYYCYKAFFKEKTTKKAVLKFLQGLAYIAFSTYFLIVIFSYPHITLSYIIYYLSIPMFFIGLAAVLKGSIVDVYSELYRKINIYIGTATLIFSVLGLFLVEFNFPFTLVSLLVLLILNGISRSGLYLSEYGLSLKNLKNWKYVFFLMDNLVVVNLQDAFRE